MWRFSSAALQSLYDVRLECSAAMSSGIITGLALPIDPEPFQRLFRTEHSAYVSLRMKRICAH